DGGFEIALAGTFNGRSVKIMATNNGARSPAQVVPNGGGEVELRVAAAAAISGVVHGATGMTIILATASDGATGHAMADDQGRFRIDGLAPGRYEVRALGDDRQQANGPTVNVAAGATTTVELAFPTGGVT